MTKKKIDFASVAEETSKNAKQFLGKAKQVIVNAADQNNDGSLDLKDVSAIAEAIGTAAKNTANAVKNSAEERNREKEFNSLLPIFSDDLNNPEFAISKLLRITEIDKKHAESEVCKGSIGFVSAQKDLRVVNVFKESIEAFGLSFHPNADCEVYYVDPCNRSRYIALDGYFNHLKIAYVNELQRIAQDLGAKHFRVIYKEKESTVSGKSVKNKSGLKMIGKGVSSDAGHDLASSAVSTVEVAAEMDCPGHAPVEPVLVYFKNDPSINNLINMRMNESSPLTHQKFTLKLSDSSGIKEREAVKIDAALKAMKIAGNTTVVSEVRNESCRFFEYEIDF